MTEQPRNLVTEFRRQLEARVGSDCFELWFSPEYTLVVNDETLTVRATDEFSMDRIKSSYLKTITDLASPLGIDQVKFEIIHDSCDVDANRLAQSSTEKLESHRSVQGSDNSSTDSNETESCGSKSADKPIAKDALSVSGRRSNRQNTGSQKYSLQDFVFDPANELLWKACQQVISNPGDISPFYVYGPAGCGKTHLLEGISSQVRRRSRSGKVQMVTAEQFTSDYIGSLKNRTMPMFRKRYRELDYLLVDDLQFFAGKKSTLQELQQTIEVVTRSGGQVVVSADRSAQELDFAGPEFIHRVACGLTTQIQSPTMETRKKIIQNLANRKAVNLEDSAIELIAEKIAGDIRLVSGALNRLRLFQFINGQSVSIKDAKKHLADLFQISHRTVSIPDIEKAVCNLFGLDQASLRSSTKVKAVSQPRMLAMWLSRKYTRAALSEIGDYFGGRSHSTVISAQSKVEKWVEKSELIGIRHSEFPVENAIRRIEQELRVG